MPISIISPSPHGRKTHSPIRAGRVDFGMGLAAMFMRGGFTSWKLRLGRSRGSVGALALMSLLGSAGCTGSPATLTMKPDFEVKTPAAIASVSIRGSLPGMTDSEFEQLVKTGMGRAAPGSVVSGLVETPFPQCRIVWHVNPDAGRGASTLSANIFDRSVPVAFEQQVVTDSAPTATITDAIKSVTSRLMVSSERCHPRGG
jgi:hypothetical protein